jgi:transglutaminase-like putative cysteine protease
MRTVLVLLALAAALPSSAQSDKEQIFAVLVEGKRVGYERQTTQRTPEGVKRVSHSLIRLSMLGTAAEQRIESIGLYSRDGRRPLRVSTQIAGVGPTIQIDVRRTGSQMEIRSNLPGAPPSRRVEWKDSYWLLSDFALPHGIPAMRAATAKGGRGTLNALDMLDGELRPRMIERGKRERITVRGKPAQCEVYRVENGARSFVVLARAGTSEVLEIRVPAQKAVFRLSDRSALQGLASFDALSRAFALSNVQFEDPLNVEHVRARVRVALSVEKPQLARLNLPYQTFKGTIKGDVIEGEFVGRMFRYDGKDAPPFTSEPPADLARFLRPEPRVESDHPEIVSLAREITAGSETTWDAVKKIGAWIKQNIRYTITGSGALQCLRDRQGDCGPHTWLTIALCRAVGIPARMTGGAVYSSLFGGSYGQHYWTRVWMGPAGWIPIDTTTGEVGTFSPTHLTFWDMGGIASLDVKVLDYSPKSRPATAESQEERPARSPLAVTRGERERWVFTMDGKEIGAQTAECVRSDENGSEWKYTLNLDAGGQKVRADGSFTLNHEGIPSRFLLKADAGGMAQQVEAAFGPRKVGLRIKVGESPVSREVDWSGKALLLPNNNMTCISLITRLLRPEPGKSTTAPVFSPEAMQSINLSLASEPRTETIAYQDVETECVVVNLSPVPGRLHVRRSDGALLRFEIQQARLLIERRQ